MMAASVWLLAFGALAQAAADQDSTVLISFEEGDRWQEKDDPVMGGQSKGTVSVVNNSAHGSVYGLWEGAVKNVSFLHAPGFCGIGTTGTFTKDISAYISGGLVLTARTTTPNYPGFKLVFGPAPKHHGGHSYEGNYKANFNVPASTGGEWQDIAVKFSDFSYDWSDFTGDCFTKDPDGFQHTCCSTKDTSMCPAASYLEVVNEFSIMAEGHEGAFHLEILKIAATTAAPSHIIV